MVQPNNIPSFYQFSRCPVEQGVHLLVQVMWKVHGCGQERVCTELVHSRVPVPVVSYIVKEKGVS